MTAQCAHLERNPEGVEWSDSDALGHFLTCLTESQKVEYWVHLRRFADTGRMCGMQDHLGRIESQRQYTVKLLAGIRVIVEYTGNTRVRNALREPIS